MILVKVCLLMRFSTFKSLKQHIVCECNEEIKTLNLNQYDLYISKNMDMPYQFLRKKDKSSKCCFFMF